jgi:MFS family permease
MQMSTGRAWLLLIILVALHILSFLDRFIILLIVDPIRQQFGVSDFQIGMLHGAAFGLFYATFAIPLGWLTDRVQRRWLICAGVFIWSLATMASGLAQTFSQLFVARLFVGAGEAALVPAAYSMLSDAFPQQRLASAFAIFAAAAPVGAASALAIGGLLIEAVTGSSMELPAFGIIRDWQIAFFILGALGIVMAFAIFLSPEPGRRKLASDSSNMGPSYAAFLKSRWRFFVPAFLAAGFSAMLGNGLFAWLPTHIVREFSWTPAEIGVAIGLITATCGAIGGVVSGAVVDRWYAAGRLDAHVRYYAFALIGVGIFVFMAFSVNSAMMCLFFYALVSLLQQFYGVVGAAVQLVTPSAFRGRTAAIYLFTYNVMGIGLGPMLVAGMAGLVIGEGASVGAGVILLAMLCTPLCSGLFLVSGRAMARLLKPAPPADQEIANIERA